MSAKIKLLSLNFANNLVELAAGINQWPNLTSEEQVDRVFDLGPEVICAQEISGRYLDLCTRRLGPECATRQIRFLADQRLDTNQNLAVFSIYPINRIYSASLGPFQADGLEITPHHVGLGRRPLEAAMLAAEIEHPIGTFWAVTAHMAWTERVNAGLQPHQIEAFGRLCDFLHVLVHDGLPVILGADFNALPGQVRSLMPSWMNDLVSQDHLDREGTSIDTSDTAKAAKLVSLGIYVDGVYATGHFALEGEIEMVTGLSDHKGHLLTLRRT